MILRMCVSSLLLLLAASSYGVESYSQVSMSGSAAGSGPKVFKAMNMDLIYPRTFNSSENVISTTEAQPSTESIESLSPTADDQLTPEDNSSSQQMSSQPLSQDEPTPAASNYPPTFVFPSNHADESRDSETTLPPTATGRAVDYRPVYPFSQLLTQNNNGYRPSSMATRPVPRPNKAQRVVYPSSYKASRTPSRAEINKLSGKGQFSDRFTPSEAVASSAFKLNQSRNRKPSISRPVGQASNKVASYVAPKDLYAFPPNVDAKYPSPSDSKQAAPSDTVTSYLPPPAGPLDNGKFVGPVNPDLLPDNMKAAPAGGEAKDSSAGGYFYNPPPNPVDLGGGGYQYPPPKTPLDAGLAPNMPAVDMGTPPTMMSMMDSPPPAMNMMDMIDVPPPAPPMDGGMMNGGMMNGGMMNDGMMNGGMMNDGMMNSGMMDTSGPPVDHDHHDHHHDIMGYEEDKEYPTPPPGYMAEHDHDHHDHDYPDHHHYHDVMYDDYHDHHHDEHVHHTEPPVTKPPPPPPPPAPAPVYPEFKKYSYFYIGRKIYYIPLYFTIWITCHVLWMLLKSIGRHKVYWTNHYVNRRNFADLSQEEANEAINKITLRIMDGIEKFKTKFLG